MKYKKGKLYYFPTIDELSRYNNAAIITKKSLAMKKFIQHWLCLYGTPKRFFSINA